MSASAQHAPPVLADPCAGRIVEHFRVDVRGRLMRAALLGVGLMTLGLLSATAAITVPRLDPNQSPGPHAVIAMGARAPTYGPRLDENGDPLPRPPTGWLEVLYGVLAAVLIPAGGLTVVLGFQRVLREDRYLALRTDGAYYQDGRERSFVPWEHVEEVHYDRGQGAVVFVRHDGTVWTRSERFGDIDGEELSRRAARVRRKSLFGLL
ncbi:MAG: hypothetical protein ACFCGT_19795 [Sandaracinaceae bacterium]